MADDHLLFEEIVPVTTKTKQWVVLSRSTRRHLGDVRWYAPWRRYCFFATMEGAIFDAECLKEVTGFIEREMVQWRVHH